jgi:3-oxoacyl-[acyl-carrier-protein] synthase II
MCGIQLRVDGSQIAITGLGVVSAAGNGCDALWRAIVAGRSALQVAPRFGDDIPHPRAAGLVPGFDDPLPVIGDGSSQALAVEYARMAAEEALLRAGAPREQVAVVSGTNLEDEPAAASSLAARLAEGLGLGGLRLTSSVACASSAAAIGVGAQLVSTGLVPIALAGGTDVLTTLVMAGFDLLGLLASEPCAPLSARLGTSLGEGAAFLVLECTADAVARGVEPLAYVWGFGMSCDAFDLTRPDGSGAGLARALTAAMDDAAVEPARIGYVNLHGTGTEANDAAEVRGLRQVFGPSLPPLSATKSIIGHAQGAAGAIEVAATLLGLQHEMAPPTVGFEAPRPGLDVDVVKNEPRPLDADAVLSINSGFGGVNTALVLGRRAPKRPRPPILAPIFVEDVAVLGSFGLEVQQLVEAWDGGRIDGNAPDLDLRRVVRMTDPRRLEPSTRWLAATAGRCVDPLSHDARTNTGLVVAMRRSCAQVAKRLRDRVRTRGLGAISAHDFARASLVSPAGLCSELLELGGPLEVLVGDAACGLACVIEAALTLRRQRKLRGMVGVGVHESREVGDGLQGAAAIRLGRGEAGGVRLVDFALAGPGDAENAVALLAASNTPDVEVWVEESGPVGDGAFETSARHRSAKLAGASAGTAAIVYAMARMKKRALVVATGADSLSCALVLER